MLLPPLLQLLRAKGESGRLTSEGEEADGRRSAPRSVEP